MAHNQRRYVEGALTEPIVAILATPGPRRATVFATILQLLRNIVKDPANGKFRRLRLANAAVQRRVLNEPLVLDFLVKLGFQFADEHLVFAGAQMPDLSPNDHLPVNQSKLDDAVLRAKQALFLLEEAKKVAAAYAAKEAESDDEINCVEESSSGHEGFTRQQFHDVLRAVAESSDDVDDVPPGLRELALRDALIDQESNIETQDDDEGAQRNGTRHALVGFDARDRACGDKNFSRLLQQRHAVASAYTAYQAHQRSRAENMSGEATWDTTYEGDNDWDKCDLCMEDIGIGAILPCCHLYCNACIRRWIKTNPTYALATVLSCNPCVTPCSVVFVHVWPLFWTDARTVAWSARLTIFNCSGEFLTVAVNRVCSTLLKI
eukprot:INCI17686.3.p2 GENE.INCI17686.3~~INCI17686.3.p2  ORF type:complete len:378 (-),score=61.73 INCI17686.3:1589-2722(-)